MEGVHDNGDMSGRVRTDRVNMRTDHGTGRGPRRPQRGGGVEPRPTVARAIGPDPRCCPDGAPGVRGGGRGSGGREGLGGRDGPRRVATPPPYNLGEGVELHFQGSIFVPPVLFCGVDVFGWINIIKKR